MLRLSLVVSAIVAAAFALPAAALAAGTVGTNVDGDMTYTGDATANIVEVSTVVHWTGQRDRRGDGDLRGHGHRWHLL